MQFVRIWLGWLAMSAALVGVAYAVAPNPGAFFALAVPAGGVGLAAPFVHAAQILIDRRRGQAGRPARHIGVALVGGFAAGLAMASAFFAGGFC